MDRNLLSMCAVPRRTIFCSSLMFIIIIIIIIIIICIIGFWISHWPFAFFLKIVLDTFCFQFLLFNISCKILEIKIVFISY